MVPAKQAKKDTEARIDVQEKHKRQCRRRSPSAASPDAKPLPTSAQDQLFFQDTPQQPPTFTVIETQGVRGEELAARGSSQATTVPEPSGGPAGNGGPAAAAAECAVGVLAQLEDTKRSLRCINPLCEYMIGTRAAMGGYCCKRCAMVYDETGGDRDLIERWCRWHHGAWGWHGPQCEHVAAPAYTKRAYGLPMPERRTHY